MNLFFVSKCKEMALLSAPNDGNCPPLKSLVLQISFHEETKRMLFLSLFLLFSSFFLVNSPYFSSLLTLLFCYDLNSDRYACWAEGVYNFGCYNKIVFLCVTIIRKRPTTTSSFFSSLVNFFLQLFLFSFNPCTI